VLNWLRGAALPASAGKSASPLSLSLSLSCRALVAAFEHAPRTPVLAFTKPLWRETKNSSFERMKAPAESSKDPCATLSDTFRREAHFGMPMKREADRLQEYLRHRPGCVFTRCPPPVVAT
jgi:hypothetical protein